MKLWIFQNFNPSKAFLITNNVLLEPLANFTLYFNNTKE